MRQRWPAPQAAPAPHLHSPAEEHESAPVAEQAAQVAPGAAHAESDSVVHAPLSQQPSGHDVASHTHTPCEQWSPALHGAPVPQWQVPEPSHVSVVSRLQVTQVEPATPHSASERVWHVALSQHPSGHDVASQTQSPAAQR